MMETKQNNKLNKYYNLYKASQQKIEDEKMISESLLNSIIKEIKISGVEFLADTVINNYYNTSTRKQWKDIFFEKMNDIFFENIEWEFISIQGVGSVTYGFDIDFKLKGNKYCLFIPYPKNLEIYNIISALEGRYSLMKEEKPGLYVHLASSYDEDEIKEVIEKESEM